MKRISFIILLSIMTIFIVGCSQQKETSDGNLTIYTSVYPLQYIAEEIGGDTVHVDSIYPPGVDAHTYEPTTKMMTKIADSDAFIYLGAGLEGFAESAAQALTSQKVDLIEIGKHTSLFLPADKEATNHNEQYDPHLFLDPLRMKKLATIIKDKMIALNPDEKKKYTTNYHSLNKKLDQLDQQFQDVLGKKTNKEILVSHAAFGYWEDRYGIKQISIHGLSTSEEPSQQELTKIIDEIKKDNLKYMIYEQTGADKLSKIVQHQLDLNVLHLHNLEVLTDDNIKNGDDYLSLMQHNLDVLDQATS